MKKILALAVVIAAFLIMPSVSSAQRIAIADSELSAISAQYSAVTATWSDPITIKGTNLSPTITNFSDFWGNKVDANAYFGITDISVTDCTFQRNGSVTLEVFPLPHSDDVKQPTYYKMKVDIDLSVSSSDMGLNQTIKLGTRSDLTTWSGTTKLPDQVLGQSYTGGISATIKGSLSIYARNN
jgi:hypothetical protein